MVPSLQNTDLAIILIVSVLLIIVGWLLGDNDRFRQENAVQNSAHIESVIKAIRRGHANLGASDE